MPILKQCAVVATIAIISTSGDCAAAERPGQQRLSVSEQELATNEALLKALIERRAEVDQSWYDDRTRQRARDYLDGQIAQLRRRMAR